ncbi:MAG TPA: long-chain fatty acid--CoA ligase [Candidatus Dormibacteraeota bacterium]|nr:long-chain fatty acid--CoA ligase [Candidatus Dormibacteraeota bacterium]
MAIASPSVAGPTPKPTQRSPETIPAVFFAQAKLHDQAPYLHFFRDGAWQVLTWTETAERAMRVACALVDAGVRPGEHVALMSPNRPEWLYCDFGIMAAGAVTVPLYPSLLPKVAGYIAADSKTRFAIAADATMAAKLAGHELPKHVFTMDEDVKRWTEMEPAADLRAQVSERLAAIKPDDVATVIYTSGTTGEPKGVIFAHTHFIEAARAGLQMFHIGPEDVLLSYLPYSHVLERVDGIFIETTAGCSFWLARSLDTIFVEDIHVARPTIMLGVPRVFEKLYESVYDQVRKQPVYRRAIFRWALGIGVARLHGSQGPWLRLRVRIAERLVLAPLREKLTGGRLRFFISGGAPLNEKVEEFFWAIGVKILQGWGLTEATSGVTSNTEEVHRYRSVGIPMPGTELRIADDGEILVKGPGVMIGYKNRPEATDDCIKGEWLKTGDMGFIDQDGFLTITDRKKDLIKTSGGKYVAPLPIEAQLENDRYVKAALVVGDSRQYVVGLIVPDWEALAADAGFSGAPATLVDDEAVRARFQKVVDAVNQNLASFETIKYFTLLERDFTEANDELTPSLKKKRRVIALHFQKQIDAMFAAHKRVSAHD